MKIKKTTRIRPQTLHERLTIKEFKHAEDGHDFLNRDNSWTEVQPHQTEILALKAGVYAFAGGKWHNVKSLDASILAHI